MDLKSAREKRGWTLDYVASLIGAANGSIVCRHEIGSRNPNIDHIDRYLAIYAGDVTEADIRTTVRAYRKRSSGSRSTRKEPVNA